jgi:hypothetical protein
MVRTSLSLIAIIFLSLFTSIAYCTYAEIITKFTTIVLLGYRKITFSVSEFDSAIVVILYYHQRDKLPYCPRYIAKGLTIEKTLSLNGLQQSMHCCTVSSRYQAMSFAASKHNYDMHITTYTDQRVRVYDVTN